MKRTRKPGHTLPRRAARAWPLWLPPLATTVLVAAAHEWGFSVGGVLAAGLLFGLLLSWGSAGLRAERSARRLLADLRQKDAALAESEYRWQFAVEGTGDGLWDWDVGRGTVWFSTRWKVMLGHTEDEVSDRLEEWSTRIHPDDIDDTMATVDAYLRGETDHYECEHRVRCKDGSYRWILDRGIVVARDQNGSPTRLIGTHKDISAQKHLEAELTRRGNDLEESQRIAGMGSWWLRPATGEVGWSAALFELFGMDPTDAAPSYAAQRALFTPESFAAMDAAVAECAVDGTPYELEMEAILSSGVHRWMVARGRAVRDGSGAVDEIRGIAIDISERRSAMQRIAQLSEMYKTLSECNAALVHCEDESALYQEVCGVVARHSGVAMAWIGRIDTAMEQVVPVACAGEGTGYVDGLHISLAAADERSQGPCGTAARTGSAVWFDDFSSDPRTAPWHDRGTSFGWNAAASLPLRQGGRTVAVLTFYSRQRTWMDDATKTLLVGMGEDISFALDRIALAADREEAEQRFRSLVEQSIAGAYIIQDEALVYANPRCKEILGYAADAPIEGIEAWKFFVPDEVDRALDREHRLLTGAIANTEANVRLRRQDGSTVHVGTHSRLATYHQRPAIIGLMQDIGDRKVAEAQIDRYVTQIEKVMLQTVGVITDLSEMRDPYTAGHEHGVARLSVEIGRRLGLDDTRLEGLRIGGLLHDVGKIAVPTEILVKPTCLTALETEMVRQHPAVGFSLLRGIDFAWPVARVAHEHHERMDGSGYPQGLKDDEICLEARIVAVADVVDSMASHRPYRAALGISAALQEIEEHKGSRYDASVVEACAALIRDGHYTFTSPHLHTSPHLVP